MVRRILRAVGAWELRERNVNELSDGERQKIMIARALVHEPKLLILDEPPAGVDIEIRRSMWDFLRDINEAGTTIILTTHYLEEAESIMKDSLKDSQDECIVVYVLAWLGWAYFELGDYDQAGEKYEEGYRFTKQKEHLLGMSASSLKS